MTKKGNTKKALLMSALSLLLCVSMLVGTTFAWFTDEVVSGQNIIAAGNLDVELTHTNDTNKDGDPEKVSGATDLFEDVALWEPGAVAYEKLTVSNVGSLALKYNLGINVANANGVRVGEEVYTLADVLKVAVVEADKLTSRESAIAAGEGKWKSLSSWSEKGMLYPKESANPEDGKNNTDTYGIVIYWEPSENDNIFNMNNGKTTTDGGKQLTIELGVHLVATQLVEEEDSYGNNYDENASVTVAPGESIQDAIKKVEDGGIVFLENGVHTVSSVITISGRNISIIGMGEVTLEYKAGGGSHFFNVADNSNVSFENLTMLNASKHGVYVRNNSVVTMKDVTIEGSKGSADIMIDEASDAMHGKETASYVWLYNSDIGRIAMCASPVTTVAATQDTYVYLNYDANSIVGSLEVQNINQKPENIIINGVKSTEVGKTMQLYVTNDAELAAALETIKTNSEYWNKQVIVYLAAGEYSADHVINQYPKWNGVAGTGITANNYASGVPAGDPSTVITFVGETASTLSLRGAQTTPAVIFTGNVKVNGFGNAQTGFASAVACTTFENIAFANGTKVNSDGNIAAVEMTAAAANITFNQCTFQNAKYVIVGARAHNIVGDITFDGCTFSDVCVSGYVDKTLTVKNSVVLDANGGFLNNQNSGDIVVDNCTINAGEYFVRTNGSGIDIKVSNSDITMYESNGTKHLVYFRGSNESAEFKDCEITAGYTTKGVDVDSTLTIRNYFNIDGYDCYTDGITGEKVLYNANSVDGTDLVIPDGINVIWSKVFNKRSGLTSITFPSSLTDIDNGAFMGTGLTSVTIPGTVSINERPDGKSHAHTFAECTSLASVTIEEGVKSIPSGCFVACTGLTEVVIPSSVESLGKKAFYDCLSLETVYLLSADCELGAQVFGANQSGYKNMTIYVVNEEMKTAVEATLTDNNKSSVTVTVLENPTVNGKTYVYSSEQLATAVQNGVANIVLADGEYKLPSSNKYTTNATINISGSEDAVLDLTWGAYAENATLSFNGISFKTTFGYVTSNGVNYGSDYAALYSKNVTYTNCNFSGAMLIGRDGASFIGCTFNDLGSDYIRLYGMEASFENCTFNTNGKAVLAYNDGGKAQPAVSIKNCTFNATQAGYAGAINNQSCAAIEIHNYGNGINLTTFGNVIDSDFSGEWRIKTYDKGGAIAVNGVTYTQTALDGKLMTVTNNVATFVD